MNWVWIRLYKSLAPPPSLSPRGSRAPSFHGSRTPWFHGPCLRGSLYLGLLDRPMVHRGHFHDILYLLVVQVVVLNWGALLSSNRQAGCRTSCRIHAMQGIWRWGWPEHAVTTPNGWSHLNTLSCFYPHLCVSDNVMKWIDVGMLYLFKSAKDPNQFDVLLVKIEGPVWYTIYHHRNLLFFRGKPSTPSFFINQPMGIWDIYLKAHVG